MQRKSSYIFDMGLASGTLIGFFMGTSQERIGIDIAIGATGGYLIAWLIYGVAKKRDARKFKKCIQGSPDTD